jgi:DNA-binding NarL/FixJ family response regulator
MLLSGRADEDQIIAAFRAGIRGYVVRADAPATLVRAIREVTGGRFFLSPGASRVLAQEYLPETVALLEVLP